MAIYHLSGTVISRSKGRSAVACAAYRCAERLYDEYYEKEHDYTHKTDVCYTEIMLPKNALPWMANREKLWNAVELFEIRKDSQLAREFNIALPRELTLEQNIALIREFVQTEFVSQGMIADVAIHHGIASDGELQPHAHVMLTMREITADGFGQKVRSWNSTEKLVHWREAWGETANRHFFLHGHDIKIDHRSFEAQGITLEPQYKIGASVVRERMANFSDHQRIAKENGEKIFLDPTIALKALTHQYSTFTHHDLARFVNRHSIDAEQFQHVFEKVKASVEIVYLGLDDKNRERFTTREMLRVESQMIYTSQLLSTRQQHVVSEKNALQALATRSLSTEQKAAFDLLTSDGDLKCIIGYAGTGKSYLLGATREAWEAQGYRVLGATLSGIAAENLEASSGIKSRTIASRTYYWDRGRQQLGARDVLVVDEAGMLGSRQMERLIHEVDKSGAKIVLIGDPWQLQAIEAGGAFRAIAEGQQTLSLTDIRRQEVAWQRQATIELATGQTADAIKRYETHSRLHVFETQAVAKQAVVEMWNDVRLKEPDKTQIILSYTRADVKDLNEMARALRSGRGELGSESTFATERGNRIFAEKDRIYFLKNDVELGVKNGTLGTIEKMNGKELEVRLDTPNKTSNHVRFTMDRYNHLDHGYAATIHKAQGVTVDSTYVLASRHMDSHAAYVGLSRHRSSVDIFYSKEEFANTQKLMHGFSQQHTKDTSLDYRFEESFAQQRGFESEAAEHLHKEREAVEVQQKPSLSKSQPIDDLEVLHKTKTEEEAQQKLSLSTSRAADNVEILHKAKEALELQQQPSNTASPSVDDEALRKQVQQQEQALAEQKQEQALSHEPTSEVLAAQKAKEQQIILQKQANLREFKAQYEKSHAAQMHAHKEEIKNLQKQALAQDISQKIGTLEEKVNPQKQEQVSAEKTRRQGISDEQTPEHKVSQTAKAQQGLTQSPASLREFKAQFEKHHAAQVQTAKEDMKNLQKQKQAEEISQKIGTLEEKAHTQKQAHKELEKYAASIHKQKDTMEYLQKNHKDLSEKINRLNESHKLSLGENQGQRQR